MKNPFPSRKASSVLVLSFSEKWVDAVVVRHAHGPVHLDSPLRFELTSDLLQGDVAELGGQVRAALDGAGIRERSCVAVLPPEWVMSVLSSLPDLPEADIADLLTLEAEQGFPFSADQLSIRVSRFKTADGSRFANQIAVPHERVARLESILKAARLNPESFSIGLDPRMVAPDAGGVMLLDLQKGQGTAASLVDGGMASLRTFGMDPDQGLSAAGVRRELRVTLGQLPPAVRQSLKSIRITGAPAMTPGWMEGLAPGGRCMDLPAERMEHLSGQGFGMALAPNTPFSSATMAGIRHLSRKQDHMEFLPPQVSKWDEFNARFGSQKLALAGRIAAGLAAILLLAFGYQQFRLMRLQSEWNQISARVRRIEEIQTQVKRFRPWFDPSVRSLAILRRLTDAFPEDGEVTAKIIEIRENLVSCSGTARDQAGLMRALDKLRSARDVADVQVDQLRGKSPLQFNFNFQWTGSTR